MEIFDLVLGQVQKGCFLVVVASALTSISSMSKHRPLRTVWDQSSSDSRRTNAYVILRFWKTNSDFQHRFSKTNLLLGSRGGTVVRALASHQCGLGSTLDVDAICGLSLLLVLSLAQRGFSPGTPVFPSPKNQHFQIPIRPGTHGIV